MEPVQRPEGLVLPDIAAFTPPVLYFIYDRDTAVSITTSCINDGSLLFFSLATNRIYTGAEIDGNTTVIEGDTDECQNVSLTPGLAQAGFMWATHHAYFASPAAVMILDEDALTLVDTLAGCRPDAYGGVDSQMIVVQELGRVFIRGYWTNPSEASCVLVIDEPLPVTQEDLLATWVGQGVFYRDSISGGWVKMASQADQVTCGDLDADGKADLIGIWPTQGGVWVKYSLTGNWAKLSSTARDISAGVMRNGGGGALSPEGEPELALPLGGLAEGPDYSAIKRDLSDTAPGGLRFTSREQKNLNPIEKPASGLRRIPGPGEPGFKAVRQANPVPKEGTAKSPGKAKAEI